MTLRLRNVHWTPLKQISDVVSKWWMPSSSQDYSSGICICACMYVCVHSSDMCETSSLTRFLSGYRSYFWRLNYFTHPFFSHIFLDNFHSWAEMSTMKAVFLGLKNSCILHILFRRWLNFAFHQYIKDVVFVENSLRFLCFFLLGI